MSKRDIDERDKKVNIFGKIAELFINQFQLTILVMLLIISIGIVGLFNLPKESLPEIVFPSITIQTLYPGASPEDVEVIVTEEIENKVKDFDDIDSISSETSFGLSIVSVTYFEGVDIDNKKIELDNALRELEFPDGVFEPRSFVFTTSEIPLMNISIIGDYSPTELTLIGNEVADAIETVKGVDSVDVSGGVEPVINIVMDELKMMKYDITYNDVQNALQSVNVSAPIGELTLNGSRFNIRTDERLKTINDFENTLVRENIYIKDIAEVTDTVKDITTYNRTYVQGSESTNAIFLTVTRKVGSDVIGTDQSIREKLDNDIVDQDVEILVFNALAENVDRDLDNIQSSAWSGLLVVIIVLFLFIGIKESIIVSITIPLSLLGTLGVLSLFGITFNTFAILGLIVALGLLVDNSIIVMENIDRLRKKGFNTKEASIYGTNQVGLPITSATMTTLAAFFPLAILPGILGAFVSTIPLTIMITISISLLVSLVITPSISSKLLKGKSLHINKVIKVILSTVIVGALSYIAFKDINNDIATYSLVILFTFLMLMRSIFIGDKGLEASKLTAVYSKFIYWIIYRKRRAFAVLVIGFIVLGLSFSTIPLGILKISFFPQGEPTSLTINIDTPGGYTLSQTDDITSEVEALLYDVEGIVLFNTTIGERDIDASKIIAELDTKQRNGFDILNEVEEKLSTIAGANISIDTAIAGPPVGKPIELRIVGEDIRAVADFSQIVQEQLRTYDGVYNISSSVSQGVPEILLDINERKALTYGTSPIQIVNQLRGEINGITATTVLRNGETVDVLLKRDTEQITDLSDLENLFIATPAGNMLTLDSFTDVQIQSGLSNISRIDSERLVTITADLKQGYNVNDIINKFQDDIVEPKDILIKYSGDIEGIEQNFGNLFQSMILAVFLVFIILTLQFKSIGQPFIILTTLPMAFIGVIGGLIITGNEFGFYAFMGLVALIGIAVNDAIVLIDFTNFLRKEGYNTIEALKEAGKTRFNPVLATTLTTISGVLPLAFKEAYYAQFSFALIFGLMVTTFLTLIFIPVIYRLFSRKVA
jgi:HAE1 family hydrophobic/amphiphilic exporter-1